MAILQEIFSQDFHSRISILIAMKSQMMFDQKID